MFFRLPVLLLVLAPGFVAAGPPTLLARIGGPGPGPGDPPAARPDGLRVSSLALAPDGRFLVTGCRDGDVRLWEPRTGRLVRKLGGHEGVVRAVAVARDGHTVASLARDRALHVWDLAADEPLRRWTVLPRHAETVRFSPDGKLLATQGSEGVTRLWGVATAGPLLSLESRWPGRPALAFSPVGAGLVTADDGPRGLVVWDPALGWRLRGIDTGPGFPLALAFSPDGRTLAVSHSSGSVRLVEMISGRERGRFSCPEETPGPAAFVAGGRVLAWAAGPSVRLTDLATGRDLHRLAGHRAAVIGVSVTAAGDLLASCDEDGTAQVWSLADLDLAPGPSSLAEAEAQALWQELAHPDAARAARAAWTLATAPALAPDILRPRVTPVGPTPPSVRDRLARYRADLDHDDFARREKATDDLAGLGFAAEGFVRRELASDTPSAEARQRLERILVRIERADGNPESLRALRAVEVLELARTPEARQVLDALAAGLPEARLTREARAALARRARRP